MSFKLDRPFEEGKFYHVNNRGNNREKIFFKEGELYLFSAQILLLYFLKTDEVVQWFGGTGLFIQYHMKC